MKRFVLSAMVALGTLAAVASGADRNPSAWKYTYNRVYNAQGKHIGTIKTGRDSESYIGPQGKVIAQKRFGVQTPYGKQSRKR